MDSTYRGSLEPYMDFLHNLNNLICSFVTLGPYKYVYSYVSKSVEQKKEVFQVGFWPWQSLVIRARLIRTVSTLTIPAMSTLKLDLVKKLSRHYCLY